MGGPDCISNSYIYMCVCVCVCGCVRVCVRVCVRACVSYDVPNWHQVSGHDLTKHIKLTDRQTL
jgi:hypothetical protein